MIGLLRLSLLLCTFFIFYGHGGELLQERAVVDYFDPAYVRNPTAFTGRLNRREPYRSNLTATILHHWGDNVTMCVHLNSNGAVNDFYLTFKICEVKNHKWLLEYLRMSMHMEYKCPFPPGNYGAYNIELPPKNFPLPISKGEGRGTLKFYLTESKKLLLKMSARLRKNQ